MKKLILSLALFSSLAIANAPDFIIPNQIIKNNMMGLMGDPFPDGHYAGKWFTYTHRLVSTDGYILDNLLIMNLSQIPELCNYTAELDAIIELNGDNHNQCSIPTAHFRLNEGRCMFLRDIPITFTSCNWDGSHLSGSYKVGPYPTIMKGTFDFIKQDDY